MILTSCVSAASDLLKGQKFSRVIIDDAQFISEAFAIVPLIKGCD